MRYKWVLLDVDGTLFDYHRAEASAIEKTVEHAGYEFQPRYIDIYKQINRKIWIDFEQGRISQEHLRTRRFELFSESIQLEFNAADFSDTYLKNLVESSFLMEGAEETVKRLYGKSGLVILTNGLKEVQRSRLAKSSIEQYFANVIISEEVGAVKPDSRIFDVAFERMGHPKREQVLIVGDGLTTDIKGGGDYGIDTCWFNPAREVCDQDVTINYQIANWSELPAIVSGTYGGPGSRTVKGEKHS